jgi:hypothetical protein
MDADSADFARRIFPATGIERGNVALPPHKLFARMKRGEFVEYVRDTMVSVRAVCMQALCGRHTRVAA